MLPNQPASVSAKLRKAMKIMNTALEPRSSKHQAPSTEHQASKKKTREREAQKHLLKGTIKGSIQIAKVRVRIAKGTKQTFPKGPLK